MRSPDKLTQMTLEVSQAGPCHLYRVELCVVSRTLHGVGVDGDDFTGVHIPKNKHNFTK